MVQAWIYDDTSSEDQFSPHQSNPIEYVPLDELAALSVDYWHLDPTGAVEAPMAGELGRIRSERSYKNHDVIYITPEKLPNYEQKIKIFFEEHLHEDEEIRFVLDGTGYFDIRSDIDGRWIRIAVSKGDLIVLPAGCYHRFTLDQGKFIQAMRLFKDMPKWEALNRTEQASDLTKARKEYLAFIGKLAAAQKAAKAARGVASINGESFIAKNNAKALANYPHMRAYNGLLYVSGISSRRPDSSGHVGAVQREDGSWELDVAAQTAAVLDNIKAILMQAGAGLGHIVDVSVFLVNMKDYAAFNEVYNKYFPDPERAPTRTTVAVAQLPHPNLLIEIKCVAADPRV